MGINNRNYSAFLNSLNIGVIILDINGEVKEVLSNKNFLSGIIIEDLIDKEVDKLFQMGIEGTHNWNNVEIDNKVISIKFISDRALLVVDLKSTEFNDFTPNFYSRGQYKFDTVDSFYSILTFITDKHGNIIQINNKDKKLFDIQDKQIIGKNISALESYIGFVPTSTYNVLNTKRPSTVIIDSIKKQKFLLNSIPVNDEEGNLFRVISKIRDIRDITQIGMQLEESRQRAACYIEELEKLSEYHNSQDDNTHIKPISDSKMKKAVNLAREVASVDSTVLLLGESGVGKELFARLIHRRSLRYNKSFITVNCGAIPESLVETELFGYSPGSFTGAHSKGKKGFFEEANNGTIFLDEIGELSLSMQVKLLRVIQEKEIVRVGDTKSIKIDIRIIAATNQNLKKLIQEGKFRTDLYYRLNVVPIHIPPLRERLEDIPDIAKQLLQRYNNQYGKKVKITLAALESLKEYEWPGNVRELENIIERLVVVGDKKVIDVHDLPEEITFLPKRQLIEVNGIIPLKQAIEEVESTIISKAFKKYSNTYKMAKVLEVNQSTIVRKLNKYETKIKNIK